MEIRPARAVDMAALIEIDGTIESTQYIHIERSGEGLSTAWKLEPRPVRQPVILANRPTADDLALLGHIANGIEEGTMLIAEHDARPMAFLAAQPAEPATIRLLDLRVDYDHRRQGLATAMIFQLIRDARSSGRRAIICQTHSGNVPAAQFLLKSGFELAGLDTARHSNHDLVKEATTLLWFVALD